MITPSHFEAAVLRKRVWISSRAKTELPGDAVVDSLDGANCDSWVGCVFDGDAFLDFAFDLVADTYPFCFRHVILAPKPTLAASYHPHQHASSHPAAAFRPRQHHSQGCVSDPTALKIIEEDEH
jgi:hypothetical protein